MTRVSDFASQPAVSRPGEGTIVQLKQNFQNFLEPDGLMILQHHAFSLPAVASHIGEAIVSVKLVNIKLNEMLMRSVCPSLAGTLCFTQAGKISSRPSLLCASAPLAVSRVYWRGLGMIIDGRGSWNWMREPTGGTAT